MKTKRITESIALSQILSLEKVYRLSISPSLPTCTPLTCGNAYFCKFGEILAAELLALALEAILRGARKSDFYRPILEKFHNDPELAQVRLITGYAPPISLRSA